MGSSEEFGAILTQETQLSTSPSSISNFSQGYLTHRACETHNKNQDRVEIASCDGLHADSAPDGHFLPTTTDSYNSWWNNSSASSFGPFAFSPSVDSHGWRSPVPSPFITAKNYYHEGHQDHDAATNSNLDAFKSSMPSDEYRWENMSVVTPLKNKVSFKGYVSRYLNAYGSPATASERSTPLSCQMLNYRASNPTETNVNSGEYSHSPLGDLSGAVRFMESMLEHPSKERLLDDQESLESVFGYNGVAPEHVPYFEGDQTENELDQALCTNSSTDKTMTDGGVEVAYDTRNGLLNFEGKRGSKETTNEHQGNLDMPLKGFVSIFTLFKYADKLDRVIMALGAVGTVINGTSLPIFSLLFGEMVERLGTNQSFYLLQEVCMWMWILAIVTLLSSYIELSAWAFVAERQALRIKTCFLRAVLKQNRDLSGIHPEKGWTLWHRMTVNVECIRDLFTHKIAGFLHHFTTFLVGYIVGFTKSWQISFIMLFSSLFLVAIGFFQHDALAKLSAREEESYAEANTLVHQTLGYIRTVFVNAAEEQMSTKYKGLLNKCIPIATKVGFVKGAGIAIFYLSGCLIWALIIWYGSVLVAANKVNGGSAVACFLATLIGGRCLGLALQYSSSFTESFLAAFQVTQDFDKVSSSNTGDLGGIFLENMKGKVEFKDIMFAYPARPELMVLRGLHFTVEIGSAIAFVGARGGGKSTIFSLMQRFYAPDKGTIHIDGVNIQDLQLQWLRQQIAVIGQEPVLFATSVRENILFGRQDAKSEEVEAAAKLANAHHFITSLEHGYDTEVGELGAMQTIGHKQMIAIAREVLKGPKILLVEDATSGLNTDMASKVQEALDKMMIGRTTMLIAKQTSTIRQGTLIAVVEEGKIVERGSHEVLLSNPNGVYTSLFSAENQMKAPILSSPLIFQGYNTHVTASPPFVFSPMLSQDSSYLFAQTSPARFQHAQNNALSLSMKPSVLPTKNLKGLINISRIINLCKPDLALLILGLLGAVHAGVTLPAYAYAIGNAISHYYDENMMKIRKQAKVNSLSIVLIGASCFVAMVFQHGFCNWAGIKLTRVLRQKTFEAILKKQLYWFDRGDNTRDSLASRIFVDSARVCWMLGDRYSVLLMGIASVGAALIICFAVNWRLAILAAGLTPLFFSSNYMVSLLAVAVGTVVSHAAKSNRLAAEAITNSKTVAVLGAEEKLVQLFTLESTLSARHSIKRTHFAGVSLGIAEAFVFGSYALLLYYGSVLVDHQKSDFAQVVTISVVLILSFFTVGSFSRLMPPHGEALAAARSVFCLIDHESKRKNQPEHLLEKVSGDIRFYRVTFLYPARPETQVLKGFDLRVKAGTKLALVGGRSSGKSTVLSLVIRLYDPVNGQIFLDGVDIKDLDLKWLRNQMALVTEEPVLFACSIWENIAYGKQNATMAEVEEAARTANAHGFITSLHDGYATQLGDKRLKMSSGHMRSIVLARAIIKEPKVVLLDEVKNVHDDLQLERKFQEALERLTSNRSTIVVSRDVETIQHARRIAVIDGGRVVEIGTHDKLSKFKEGFYYSMVKAAQKQQQQL